MQRRIAMLYLSENLKKARVMKNLTQEDVAERLVVTPQSVSKWERGVYHIKGYQAKLAL